jgi:hypothetical protein
VSRRFKPFKSIPDIFNVLNDWNLWNELNARRALFCASAVNPTTETLRDFDEIGDGAQGDAHGEKTERYHREGIKPGNLLVQDFY